MHTFSIQDIARERQISEPSARVYCSRAVQSGKIYRVKNNLYVARETWLTSGIADRYSLSNLIQVPSYISLTTALSYYETTTQVYQEAYEAIATRRSIRYEVAGIPFTFQKVNRKYYQGYVLRNGYFIATREKALADILYLSSLGRYSFDFSALEIEKFDLGQLAEYLEIYPERVNRYWEAHGAV